MVRIVLCDDEHKVQEEVSEYIKKYAETKPNLKLEIICFDSVKGLKDALDAGNTFDIFILDIYIGQEMGTHFARELRKRGIESPSPVECREAPPTSSFPDFSEPP